MKLFSAVFNYWVAFAIVLFPLNLGAVSSTQSNCAELFTEQNNSLLTILAQKNVDDLLTDTKKFYHELVSNPKLIKTISNRRILWRKAHPHSPNNCPIPELLPTALFFLKQMQLNRSKFQKPINRVVIAAYDKVEQDLVKLIKKQVPYDDFQKTMLDVPTAFRMLHLQSYGSSEEALNLAKMLEVPQKHRKGWMFQKEVTNKVTQDAFADPRQLILPVPFPIGFKSLTELWMRKVFPIGEIIPDFNRPPPGISMDNYPEVFAGHDYGHWENMNEKVGGAIKEYLPEKKFESLLSKFRTAVDGVSPGTRAGGITLEAKDISFFHKAIDIALYISVHEDAIAFGRQLDLSYNSFHSFSNLELEKMLGPNWRNVLDFTLAWYNNYWKKNRIPSKLWP